MSRAQLRRRRLLAVLGACAVIAIAIAGLGSGGPTDSAGIVRAEFESARGLVEGNDVRIAGAPAGTVESLELTASGTALATLRLHDGIEPPRADASAAIRPVDLIGDTYVALDPGTRPDAARRHDRRRADARRPASRRPAAQLP